METTTLADDLEAAHEELRSAIDALEFAERREDTLLVERDEAFDHWKQVYRSVASMVEGALRFAGEEELADRLRPTTRWHVGYPDYDGITLLLDDRAIRRRYRDEEFGYDPDRLLDLMETGELSALDTRGGGADSELILTVDEELELDAWPAIHPEPVEGGVIRLRSDLVVTDWARYTRRCHYEDGEVEGDRIELPDGDYRVRWYRNYPPDVDSPPSDGPRYLVVLQSGAEPGDASVE